jgi:hypothetical protein
MNTDFTNERWMRLCELAANEQDPEKLLKLVMEINRLLDERESLLKGQRTIPRVNSSDSSILGN